jgi:hypothetical protein
LRIEGAIGRPLRVPAYYGFADLLLQAVNIRCDGTEDGRATPSSLVAFPRHEIPAGHRRAVCGSLQGCPRIRVSLLKHVRVTGCRLRPCSVLHTDVEAAAETGHGEQAQSDG